MTRKQNLITLRHPKYGDRTITQTQYNLLHAAAKSNDTRTSELVKQLHLSEGTINNAFSRMIGELQVANRAAVVKWFKESEIVNNQATIEKQHDLLSTIQSRQQSFTIALTTTYAIFSTVIFGYILVFHARHSEMNAWSNLYSVIPLIGGLMGAWIVHMARTIAKGYYYLPALFVCLGMIFWSIGGFIWIPYNLIEKIEIPYPAIPDWIGYLPAAIFIVFGYLLLHKRTTKDWLAQLIFVIIVSAVFGFAIFMFMWYFRGWKFIEGKDPEKILLDVGYPLADIVSLMLLLLTRITGKQELLAQPLKRMLQWLIIGMLLYLVADISFGVTTTLPDDNDWQYFPGNYTDFIFMTTFFVLSLTIIRIPIQVARKTAQNIE